MERIQRISYCFRLLFSGLMGIIPVMSAISWAMLDHRLPQDLWNGFSFGVGIKDSLIRSLPLYTITPQVKLLGFLVDLIPLGVTLISLYFLVKLFKLYEQGKIFQSENIYYIRNFGIALIISEVLMLIYEPLMTLVLTANNPPGQRMLKVSFGTAHLEEIMIGFLIILISWIMDEGRKLKEQEAYII